jgi:hypothetical protein
LYTSVRGLTGQRDSEMADQIVNTSLEQIFSAWHIIPTIWNRLNRIETIVLVSLAVLADAIACYITSRAIAVHREIWLRQSSVNADPFRPDLRDINQVRYIWAPFNRADFR